MFIELDLFYVFYAVLDIGPFGGFAVQPAALQVKDAFACRSCLFCDNVDVLNACHIAFANHLNGDAAQGGNRDKDYFFLIGELKNSPWTCWALSGFRQPDGQNVFFRTINAPATLPG